MEDGSQAGPGGATARGWWRSAATSPRPHAPAAAPFKVALRPQSRRTYARTARGGPRARAPRLRRGAPPPQAHPPRRPRPSPARPGLASPAGYNSGGWAGRRGEGFPSPSTQEVTSGYQRRDNTPRNFPGCSSVWLQGGERMGEDEKERETKETGAESDAAWTRKRAVRREKWTRV
ncbi:uncharacterized protein [Sagmatias obliquidens]|uniref:uncharacterized protein n=1 Tax=Sagmatias obliquidens TaxID=3371155 RepID=UPI000F44432C|nr:uncharacterized protein LOC113626278 [Lagenorhynchus obliquidens]